MTQVQLAKLMGVSTAEVARRIEALLALFDAKGLPRPILVSRTSAGVVTYVVNPSQKYVLKQKLLSN